MSLFTVTTLPLGMAPPSDGQAGNPFMSLLPLVLIMFIFYFLVIRPQQRRHKEHQEMLKALSRGDRVITNGGMFATVVDVKDDLIVVAIAEGVKVEVAKHAVSAKIQPRSKSEARGGKGKGKNEDAAKA